MTKHVGRHRKPFQIKATLTKIRFDVILTLAVVGIILP